MNEELQIGDILVNASPHALCRKVRVTKITETMFVADVLEGEDTSEPVTVFRAGWGLYKKSEGE